MERARLSRHVSLPGDNCTQIRIIILLEDEGVTKCNTCKLKLDKSSLEIRAYILTKKEILYWNKIASQLLANFKSKEDVFLKDFLH